MGRYDDIIGLEHPVSRKHKPMAVANRAAQFAPFAALTGYDDAIDEAARLTERKREIGDCERLELDIKLRILLENVKSRPWVRITHFVQDERKEGGRYIVSEGKLKKLRLAEADLVLEDGEEISLVQVADIESVLFQDIYF